MFIILHFIYSNLSKMLYQSNTTVMKITPKKSLYITVMIIWRGICA